MSGSHCYGHIFQTPKSWNIEIALLWCICKLLPFLLNFLIEHLYLLLKWKLSFADSSIVAWLKEVEFMCWLYHVQCWIELHGFWERPGLLSTASYATVLIMCCSSSWSILGLLICSWMFESYSFVVALDPTNPTTFQDWNLITTIYSLFSATCLPCKICAQSTTQVAFVG